MAAVVIVGGGYAGVRCAFELAQQKKSGGFKEHDITLISKSKRHVEYPSMYEVAVTCPSEETRKNKRQIAAAVGVPLTELFRGLPVRVRRGTAERVDTSAKRIVLRGGETVPYDTLVLAPGAKLADFGVPGVKENAFSVKTFPQALRLRYHVARQIQQAAAASSEEFKRRVLTFVVVGGGATGVEMAAELAHHAAEHCSLHRIDRRALRVVIVEAKDRILSGVPEHLREKAQKRLKGVGVEVRCGSAIKEIRDGYVLAGEGGERLDTNTVIWSAGLQTHQLLKEAGFEVGSRGVVVEPTLMVKGYDRIFAAGDCAVIPSDEGRPSVPATVPAAYNQGSLAARNIVNLSRGRGLEPYQHHKLGQLITLGGKKALLVTAGGRGWLGFLPWAAKMAVTFNYWRRLLPWRRAVGLAARNLRLRVVND